MAKPRAWSRAKTRRVAGWRELAWLRLYQVEQSKETQNATAPGEEVGRRTMTDVKESRIANAAAERKEHEEIEITDKMIAAGVAEIGELLDCTGHLNCTVGMYTARRYARRIYANMALLSPARKIPK
jgi:hypothetical protein